MSKIKKVKGSKYKLSDHEQKLCHGIIHSASTSAAAVGAGLAQLPLADNAVITPIQIGMIISLGTVFGQAITKTVAQSLLGGFVANVVGRGISQAAIGWIPIAGNVTNAVTAATITETIGWISVDYFCEKRESEKAKDNQANDKKESQRTEEKPKEEIIALKERLNPFFNQEKTRKNDRAEYEECLKEVENLSYKFPNNVEVQELYCKFLDTN